jgi:copper chaperone
MKSVTFKIQGMHCGGCAQSIRRLLERHPGIDAAEVSFESGEARVRFDPTQLSTEQLPGLLEAAGYHAQVRAA